MRIRIVRKPTQPEIDGVNLSRFEVGCRYEVGPLVTALLLAEGWAEAVDSNESEAEPTEGMVLPANLTREIFPPYYDAPPALAADRRRRRRRRR